MMPITTGQRIIILMAILFSTACATTPSKSSPPSHQHAAIDNTNRAHESLLKGDYEQALTLYADTYRKHDDKDLLDKYLQAGNEVKNAADVAFQNGDYAKAGLAYRALVNSMITGEDNAKTLSFDEDYLIKQIKTCGDRLTEQGLLLYRQQNLNEAVAVWKKVLTFDPNNKAVAKNIDTVNRQLRNLKSINE